MGSIIFIKKKEIDFIGRRNEMATIRERVNSTSDSYYVSAIGYRHARKRLHDDKVNYMGNALSLIIGGLVFIFGLMIKSWKMWAIGLGIFAFGLFMNWIIAKQRKARGE